MLIQKFNLYAIPGWGFRASIFNELSNEVLNFVGLDYLNVSPLSLEPIAQHLSSKLPDQAVLFGWSLGGLIAIQLAALFPKKVKKLILLTSQPRLRSTLNWIGIDENHAHDFAATFIQNFNKQMDNFIRLVYYPTRSATLRQVLRQHLFKEQKQPLNSLLKILFDADLRAEYHRLDMDILHLINKQDALIPQTAIQLKKLNPRVQTRTFQNGGHAGFLTNPAAYRDAIQDFLNND